MKGKKRYKVVTTELKSLGLRKNPNILTFPINEWVVEPNPQYGCNDNGGIWIANGLGQARGLLQYMKRKGIDCEIFEVEFGKVLFENSYRIKTDKVKLIKQVQ